MILQDNSDTTKINGDLVMSLTTDELKKFDLFSDLNENSFEIILDHSTEIDVEPDEVIFEQDSRSTDCFYVIVEGEIGIEKLMRDTQKNVATLKEGNFFGELGLFRGDKRRASAKGLKKSRLIKIPRSALRHLKSDQPKNLATIYENFMDELSRRFDTLAQKAEKTQFWL